MFIDRRFEESIELEIQIQIHVPQDSNFSFKLPRILISLKSVRDYSATQSRVTRKVAKRLRENREKIERQERERKKEGGIEAVGRVWSPSAKFTNPDRVAKGVVYFSRRASSG